MKIIGQKEENYELMVKSFIKGKKTLERNYSISQFYFHFCTQSEQYI